MESFYRFLLRLLIIGITVSLLSVLGHPNSQTKILQYAANQAGKTVFKTPLTVEKAYFDLGMRFHLRGLKSHFKPAKKQEWKLKINSLDIQVSLLDVLLQKIVPMNFSGVKIQTLKPAKSTLAIADGRIDTQTFLRLNNITGSFPAQDKSVPFSITSAYSALPIKKILSAPSAAFPFSGFHFAADDQAVINGELRFFNGPQARLEVDSAIQNLDLSYLEWVNPENLKGMSGKTDGALHFAAASAGDVAFKLRLTARESGGNLQARLFQTLSPYLPANALPADAAWEKDPYRVIHFETASVESETVDKNRMKVLLKLLVPDYNLNLNLNVEVRFDTDNPLSKLTKIMGLITVRGQNG